MASFGSFRMITRVAVFCVYLICICAQVHCSAMVNVTEPGSRLLKASNETMCSFFYFIRQNNQKRSRYAFAASPTHNKHGEME